MVICYSRPRKRIEAEQEEPKRKEIRKGCPESKGKLSRRTEGSTELNSPYCLVRKKPEWVTWFNYVGRSLGTLIRALSEVKSQIAVGRR